MLKYEDYVTSDFTLSSGQSSTDFIRSKFDYGTRQRRTVTGYNSFNVRLVLTLVELNEFKLFWGLLNDGADSFKSDQVINTDKTYSKIVRFTATYSISTLSTDLFTVTVPLELIQKGTVIPPNGLEKGLISHYLLNNNADDSFGTFDGSVVGTVDFTGDQLDTLTGSVTIPSTGGVWCSYWLDTGTGFVFTTSLTVPSSLAVDNYSNLRVYDAEKTGADLVELQNEGYYPKPLTEPTTTGLIAHYPLTGTAEDSTGTYDGTEGSLTYIDNAEFGSVANFDGSTSFVSLPPLFGANYTHDTSVSLWMVGTLNDANLRTLFIMYGDGVEGSYYIYTINGICRLAWQNMETTSSLDGTIDISDGKFHHIEVKHDNSAGTLKLFVDGVEDISAIVSTNVIMTGGTITSYLGKLSSNIRYFEKNISRFRIYSKLLTTQESLDIYNYENNFRAIDIDDGLIAYYPLKNNSLDNYYNEYDATNDGGVTYDGTEATIGSGISITFPLAIGFVEAYYIKDGIHSRTIIEADFDTLSNCTLSEVRKYSKLLSADQQKIIGFII